MKNWWSEQVMGCDLFFEDFTPSQATISYELGGEEIEQTSAPAIRGRGRMERTALLSASMAPWYSRFRNWAGPSVRACFHEQE